MRCVVKSQCADRPGAPGANLQPRTNPCQSRLAAESAVVIRGSFAALEADTGTAQSVRLSISCAFQPPPLQLLQLAIHRVATHHRQCRVVQRRGRKLAGCRGAPNGSSPEPPGECAAAGESFFKVRNQQHRAGAALPQKRRTAHPPVGAASAAMADKVRPKSAAARRGRPSHKSGGQHIPLQELLQLRWRTRSAQNQQHRAGPALPQKRQTVHSPAGGPRPFLTGLRHFPHPCGSRAPRRWRTQ